MNYLSKNIYLRYLILILIAVLLYYGSYSGVFSLFIQVSPLAYGIYFLVLIACVHFLFVGLQRFIYGDIGERVVLHRLRSLAPEYKVIPDVMIGEKGNVDVVVVGPKGLWVFEVKSHKGNVTYYNQRLYINRKSPKKDFLKQTYAEALRVQEHVQKRTGTRYHVYPVLMFANRYTRLRFGMKQIRGVYVISIHWVEKLFQEVHRDVLLTKKEVETIASCFESG